MVLASVGKAVDKPVITYCERKIGKHVFYVTNVFKGEFELAKALEDLTIRKILNSESAS